MMKKKPLYLAMAAVFHTGVLVSFSSIAAEEGYTFDEVVVSATRSEQAIEDVAASIAVIDSHELDANMTQDLQQAVEAIPGVSISGTGRFGFDGFNIRGLNDNYVKTMIDGVQLPNSYNPGGGVIRKSNNTIEVDTLQRIEINKGPVSSLYGSDAFAGAVLMRTKTAADVLAQADKAEGNHSAVAVNTGYYSVDDSYKATLELANRHDALESLLIYTYRNGNESKSFFEQNDAVIGVDRQAADPLEYHSNNLLLNLNYQLESAQWGSHTLGVTAEGFKREQDIQRLSDNGSSIGIPGIFYYLYSDTAGRDEDSRARYSFDHTWQMPSMLFDQLHWQMAYLDTQSDHDTTDEVYIEIMGVPPSTNLRNRQRNSQDQSWQFELQLDKALRLGSFAGKAIEHEWVYGASYLDNDFSLAYKNYDLATGDGVDSSPLTPNASSKKWGLFIQDQAFLLDGQWVVNGGLRYDKFEASPEHPSYQDSSNDAVTGRIGTVYHFSDLVNAYGQVSQGFKAPTVQDLYFFYDSPGSNIMLIPNDELDAEKSVAYEVGLRLQHQVAQLSIAAYYNDYQDFIVTDVIDAPEFPDNVVMSQINLDQAEIYGAEFNAKADYGAMWPVVAGLYTEMNLAYARGEDKETNTRLNTVSPLTGYVALGFDDVSELWGSKLAVSAVAGKRGDDWAMTDNVSAPGYAKVDVTAYYKPLPELILRAGLFNALDAEYWDYMDLIGRSAQASILPRLTQAGRHWSVEASYRF